MTTMTTATGGSGCDSPRVATVVLIDFDCACKYLRPAYIRFHFHQPPQLHVLSPALAADAPLKLRKSLSKQFLQAHAAEIPRRHPPFRIPAAGSAAPCCSRMQRQVPPEAPHAPPA